jgi:hypothetical protein
VTVPVAAPFRDRLVYVEERHGGNDNSSGVAQRSSEYVGAKTLLALPTLLLFKDTPDVNDPSDSWKTTGLQSCSTRSSPLWQHLNGSVRVTMA